MGVKTPIRTGLSTPTLILPLPGRGNNTAAHEASGVFAQRAAHDIHVQRVDRQQLAAQAAFYPDEQLERFCGL